MSSNPHESESVALTKARAEVGTLTADQRRTVTSVAGLWSAEWTTLEKVQPKDLEFIARLIVASFPEFGELEILRYFTILGGRFYETGEFWMHQAAQHPAYRGSELVTIKPDSLDWSEYLGEQLPAPIAAAVKCIGKRAQYQGGSAVPLHDREGNEVLRVETEAAYVVHTDPILGEYEWLDLSAASSRGDAEKRAKELAPPGAAFEVFWQKQRPGGPPGKWIGKAVKPRPDAIALAFKKARTSASRRCLRRLFSLGEARVSSVLGRINQRIDAARLPPGDEEGKHYPWVNVGGLRMRSPGTPPGAELTEVEYGAPDARQTPRETLTVQQAIDEGQRPLKAESKHDADADRKGKAISEEDRRTMYTWLEGKKISLLGVDEGDAHEALHVLIRETRGLPPGTPASTQSVTYLEYEEIARRAHDLPEIEAPENPPPFGGAK